MSSQRMLSVLLYHRTYYAFTLSSYLISQRRWSGLFFFHLISQWTFIKLSNESFQCWKQLKKNLWGWLVVGMKWRTINDHSIHLSQYKGNIFHHCVLSCMQVIYHKSIRNVLLISCVLALAFLSLCSFLIHTLQGGNFQFPNQFIAVTHWGGL